ncbi:MAG: glucan biosynthesis protein [Thermohalobaculum sp.]|nr:glucan biosynthesis protein [Thermohalobaculum sp.]
MSPAGGRRLSRRAALAGAGALAAAAGVAGAQQAAAPAAEAAPPAPPFGFADVVQLARERAGSEYAAPAMTLRAPFADLDYDRYRAIRFDADRRLLNQPGAVFALDLLPPGLVYRQRVDVSIVRAGVVEKIAFDPDMFRFDPQMFPFPDGRPPADAPRDMDFSGFRLRHPINSPDVLDECLVFQGASYFRAIARDMVYGLSARGLAIGTADPRGEEFPQFRAFWIHEPRAEAREIVVHALLDSASATGAFDFVIRPGDTTLMEVRCRIFPRREIAQIGIAALTSMYFFGHDRRGGIDDFRDAVHDSAGLQMITGQGTRLWRPLSNPARVQTSAFVDENPKGFGLTQRPRDFAAFGDAEARYDLRPSAWVEPLGPWGPGAIMLVEIPVENEFNDNIVAFWRPRDPLAPTAEGHAFAYRLHWCDTPPDSAPLARVAATRVGRSIHDPARHAIVVDFARPPGRDGAGFARPGGRDGALRAQLAADAGAPSAVTLAPLPGGDLLRAAFTVENAGLQSAELQLALETADGQRASETWLYRWTQR